MVTRRLWASIRTLNDRAEPTFAEVVAGIGPADLILVEGYKRDHFPRIEVRNLDLDHPPLDNADGTVMAIAASGPVAGADIPVFGRDDIEAITAFVIARMELDPR